MPGDSKNLVATLQKVRLIDPVHLQRLDGLQAQFPDAKELANQLIRAGLLTPFQVNQLLQGRGADLVLGPYRLLDRLGEGGMGQVFKAQHERMGRIVALKVIRKDKLADPMILERFQRETRAAAQLNHPNIVRAFDADAIGPCHLLVMEYVEGADLSQLVKRSGPLPIRTACEYVRQAALGLQHAHDKGVIHRDIKPSNILVAKAEGSLGAAKILDMGLARLQDPNGEETSSATMTQSGSVVGTPDFIAPEQARSSRQTDGRSDIYSLGCTLYYLLGGQVPFPTGTVTEKLLHHVMDEPRPVEQLRPEVPPELAAMVRKMMAKSPQKRYQTPAEAAADLEAWLAGARTTAPGGLMKPIQRIAGKVGRRRLLAGSLALAVLMILASFFLFRSSAATNNQTQAQGERRPTATAAPPPSPAVEKSDPVGTWKWNSSFSKRMSDATLRITPEGSRLTGTLTFGDMGRPRSVDNLTFKDGQLSFTIAFDGKKGKFNNRFTGKLRGDTIKGTWVMDMDDGTRQFSRDWEAKRVKE